MCMLLFLSLLSLLFLSLFTRLFLSPTIIPLHYTDLNVIQNYTHMNVTLNHADLNAGLESNAVNNDGMTPLHHAALMNCVAGLFVLPPHSALAPLQYTHIVPAERGRRIRTYTGARP